MLQIEVKKLINQWVQQLINQAFAAHLIEQEDVIYARNQVLSLLRLAEFIDENEDRGNDDDIPDLLEKIVDYACAHRIIEDVFDEKEIFSSKLMNVLIARPSAVNQIFYDKYQQSPMSATEYFYELSKNSQYIQMKRISQNIEYKVDTEYGELDITINLSKPEKDPKSIELEQMARNMDYPKCLLCIENEGYAGRIGHPARSNHRMIHLNLLGDSWYLQFSPYVYYQEHCIVLSEKHTDMVISAETFLRLLTFVEKFPHYFLGSNAELPIVGGSILSHEHYQGGNYEFAMAKADSEWTFELARFPDVECSIVKWPMSVIRLRSKQIQSLVEAGEHYLEKWRNYSDEALEIIARTDEIPHNTITPIARKKESFFELDVVLRNNRTNEGHPLGIFHPHEDVHHIKKENIGLIEVMGLAVLPARLKEELEEVKKYILGEVHMVAGYHIAWAEELKGCYQSIASEADIDSFVNKEVGKKFLKALENAAVFKRDKEGREGFRRFISACQSDRA